MSGQLKIAQKWEDMAGYAYGALRQFPKSERSPSGPSFGIAFLGLSLNPKTRIFPAHQGIDFAGYRTWPTHRLPRKRNVLKARRRFRLLMESYGRGEITLDDVRPSVASFLGYMKHCSSYRTVQEILNDLVLKRNIGEVN